jgi:predicted permease
LNFSNFTHFKKEWLSISFVKFLFSPFIGMCLTYMLHLSNPITTVVLVQAGMPVANAALILSNLFELDQDLANSCWLFTTFISLLTTPILLYALNFL